MAGPHVYKIVELVGTSPDSIESAIQNAIHQAGEHDRHLDWFEVREIRGDISEGKVAWYQVKMGIGSRAE